MSPCKCPDQDNRANCCKLRRVEEELKLRVLQIAEQRELLCAARDGEAIFRNERSVDLRLLREQLNRALVILGQALRRTEATCGRP